NHSSRRTRQALESNGIARSCQRRLEVQVLQDRFWEHKSYCPDQRHKRCLRLTNRPPFSERCHRLVLDTSRRITLSSPSPRRSSRGFQSGSLVRCRPPGLLRLASLLLQIGERAFYSGRQPPSYGSRWFCCSVLSRRL